MNTPPAANRVPTIIRLVLLPALLAALPAAPGCARRGPDKSASTATQPAVQPASWPSVSPKAIKEVAGRLGSKDFDAETRAIEAADELVRSRPPGADMSVFLPLIEPLFAHANYGGIGDKHWRLAADVLVRIGQPAVPLLVSKLTSEDSHNRWSAMDILSRIGQPKELVLSSARSILKDRDHYVRSTAIKALGRLGKEARDAVGDLEVAAKDENQPNQVSALLALIRIEGISDARIKAIAGYLKSKHTEGAADYAASVLGGIGPPARIAAPELREALKSLDTQLRIDATGAIGRIGDDSDATIDALIDRLDHDPHLYTRRAAASSFGLIGPKAARALPVLRAAIKNGGKDEGWWIAEEAIRRISSTQPATQAAASSMPAPTTQPARELPTADNPGRELIVGLGKDLTLEAAMKQGYTLAAVCTWGSYGGSSSRVLKNRAVLVYHETDVLDVLGGKTNAGQTTISISYFENLGAAEALKNPETGERFIWILRRIAERHFEAIKALPDTPENRQAVRALAQKVPAIPLAILPTDDQLKEQAAKVRARFPRGGAAMWRSLAELVQPGMTLGQLDLVFGPAEFQESFGGATSSPFATCIRPLSSDFAFCVYLRPISYSEKDILISKGWIEEGLTFNPEPTRAQTAPATQPVMKDAAQPRLSLGALSKAIASVAGRLGSKDFDILTRAIEEADVLVRPGQPQADRSVFGPLIEPLFAHANCGGEGREHWRLAADVLVRIGQPAVPLLVSKLNSEDSHHRWSAMEIMSRIGEPKELVLSSAKSLLKDRDRWVRRTAIEALGKFGKDAREAVGDLEAAARDDYQPNRVSALMAIIRIEGISDARIKAIAAILKSQDEDDAADYAAAMLGEIGPPARVAVPELREALQTPDAQLRSNAAAAIGRIGDDSDATIDALLDRLSNDPIVEVRRSAASALRGMGPRAGRALPALREAEKAFLRSSSTRPTTRPAGGSSGAVADAIGRIHWRVAALKKQHRALEGVIDARPQFDGYPASAQCVARWTFANNASEWGKAQTPSAVDPSRPFCRIILSAWRPRKDQPGQPVYTQRSFTISGVEWTWFVLAWSDDNGLVQAVRAIAEEEMNRVGGLPPPMVTPAPPPGHPPDSRPAASPATRPDTQPAPTRPAPVP